jgi:hypothetical protein
MLNESSKATLRRIAAMPCHNPGICPCQAMKVTLADAMRMVADDVADEQLANILLNVSGVISVMSHEQDVSGWGALQVVDLIAGAAVELAALELGETP